MAVKGLLGLSSTFLVFASSAFITYPAILSSKNCAMTEVLA